MALGRWTCGNPGKHTKQSKGDAHIAWRFGTAARVSESHNHLRLNEWKLSKEEEEQLYDDLSCPTRMAPYRSGTLVEGKGLETVPHGQDVHKPVVN